VLESNVWSYFSENVPNEENFSLNVPKNVNMFFNCQMLFIHQQTHNFIIFTSCDLNFLSLYYNISVFHTIWGKEMKRKEEL